MNENPCTTGYEDFMVEVGWLHQGDKLYVNADDLIVVLRTGDYGLLADDFQRIADDERAVQ